MSSAADYGAVGGAAGAATSVVDYVNSVVLGVMRGGALMTTLVGGLAIGAGAWRIVNYKRANPSPPAGGAPLPPAQAPLHVRLIRDLEVLTMAFAIPLAAYSLYHLTISAFRAEYRYVVWDLADIVVMGVLIGITAVQAWGPASIVLNNRTAGIIEIVFGVLGVALTFPWLMMTLFGREFSFLNFLSINPPPEAAVPTA